jgi:HEAT repeat protein
MRPRYADLFARMRSQNPDERDAAFDAVLFERRNAIPDLIACYALAKKEYLLRFYAIQLLGFTRDKGAAPTLITALDDPEPMVRAEACRGLGDLGLKSSLEQIKARLDDFDIGVRIAAAEAIAIIK